MKYFKVHQYNIVQHSAIIIAESEEEAKELAHLNIEDHSRERYFYESSEYSEITKEQASNYDWPIIQKNWPKKGKYHKILESGGTISYEIEVKDFSHIQDLIGGYAEIVRYKNKLLYINADGLIINLNVNAWAKCEGLNIVGNIVEIEIDD